VQATGVCQTTARGINKQSGNASGHKWFGIEHRLPEVVMQDEHLTVDECDEIAEALRQDAASLPSGLDKELS
jgi:hypothetical protein